jgi:hypothetical protein
MTDAEGRRITTTRDGCRYWIAERIPPRVGVVAFVPRLQLKNITCVEAAEGSRRDEEHRIDKPGRVYTELRQRGLTTWRCTFRKPPGILPQCGRLTYVAHIWGSRYVLADINLKQEQSIRVWIENLPARSTLRAGDTQAELKWIIARDRTVIETLEFLRIPAPGVLGPEHEIPSNAFSKVFRRPRAGT